MSRKKYPMSEQDAHLMISNTKELKGGNTMVLEDGTNNLLEDFEEIDFDFGDLVEETPTTPAPATSGANALSVEPEVAPKKATRKKKSAKLEVVKETTTPTVETPISQAPEVASKGVQTGEATPNTTTAQTGLTTAQKARNGLTKLSNIETYLNEKFLEREEVIANALRTLVVGSNMLLLGEPGTGKSDLIQSLTALIDGANHFSWLVNRTSDPAELVGPYSIKAMEQDKFVRKTAGKLPEAHVAFIDEIKLGLLA